MANTKTTTRTRLRPLRFGLIPLGVALTLFAVLNLCLTLAPVAKSNQHIEEAILLAQSLPASERSPLFASLKNKQEINLAAKPSEPYGWARLAYLRFQLTGDHKSAFAALRMSDFVSPYEGHEMPERAFMWHQLHDVETPAQQEYEDALWDKAYEMERDATWNLAVHTHLVDWVGNALKKTDPDFYEEWKARVAGS